MDRQTNEQTDICECIVAFATEKLKGLKVANNADIFVTSAPWEFAWPNSDFPNIEARIEVR